MFTKRDFIKLLAPLIVEQILTVLVGMVDVVMAAAVGEAAVSGVSLVDSISVLIIQVFAALSTGGAVVAAQYLGREESGNACKAAGQLVMVTAFLSAAVTAASLAGGRGLLEIVFGEADESVMEAASVYFCITALSYPFLALYNSCAALFRSTGNSSISMATSLVMNAINVAGNAICIYGLHMGVEGIAYPTLLSRIVASALMIWLIGRPENIISVRSLSGLRPNRQMIRRILSIGIPNGLENGMFQFGKIALQSLVSSLGTSAIASFAVASNLVTLLYLPGNAIGLGMITVVGQCVGAGAHREAKKYTRDLLWLNYGILAVLCFAIIVGAWPLVGLYRLSGQTAAVSVELIVAHSIAMAVWPPAFLLPNALRASFDAKFTMAVSVFSMWAFRIGFAYLFVKVWDMGVIGVWYGMFIDWIFRSALFVMRFRSYERRMNRTGHRAG